MSLDDMLAALRELLAAAEADGRDLTEDEAERAADLTEQINAAKGRAEVRSAAQALLAPVRNDLHVYAGAAKLSNDVHERAFEHYIRTAEMGGEFRAQSEGVGSAGGFLVPEGFRQKMVERRLAFGGLASQAETISTDSGNPLPWVTNDDTSNQGEIVAEGSTFAAGADLSIGTKVLGAYKYMSGGASNLPLKVSVELAQDSAFNLQEFISRKLAERIARKQAAHWATGTGVSEPQGILSTSAGLTSAKTIATNATGPTYAELIDIVHGLDPEYRNAPGCVWVFNDATLQKVRKLVDGQSRPILWDSSMNLGDEPGGLKLLGFPVVIDQGFPDPSASNKFLVFGNVRECYVIRRVKGFTLVTLNELYAPNGQIGYMGWERADGLVQDTNAAVVATAAA